MQKTSNYLLNKIEHLRRQGLVGPRSAGIGIFGGACPDWLTDLRKERKAQEGRKLARSLYGKDDGL